MAIRPTYTLEGIPELDKALIKLAGRDIDKALDVGFRRAAKPIPGYMAQAMAKHYTPKQRTLKDAISTPRIITAGAGASIEVRSSAKPFSGRLFAPLHGVRWQDKKNASIKVFKGGTRKPRKNAFRNPAFASGGPFVRDGDGRTPISKMMGPSFHNAFTGGKHKAAILDHVESKAMEKLQNSVIQSLKAKSRGFIK